MAHNVDDIVAMLDGMVANETGHINVTFDENQEGDTIQTMKSRECLKGSYACDVPTLFEGMDDKFAEDYK